MSRICSLFILLFCLQHLCAQYDIRGRINLHQNYGNTLYLSTIESLDDLYGASPDYIINKTQVDSQGHFILNGNDLPNEDRLFRLYLSPKNTDTYLFRGGSEENFIHVVLNNSSKITITASKTGSKIFDEYQISGSPVSVELAEFYSLLERLSLSLTSEVNSQSKKTFIDSKLNRSILTFAEQASSPLVSLIAISHIDLNIVTDDIKKRVRSLYHSLSDMESVTYYKTSLDDSFKDILNPPTEKNRINSIIAVLSILLGVSWLTIAYLLFFYRKNHQSSKLRKRLESLSQKEAEVLHLLWQGRTNKEIALALNVEVTTVKSHIHNIYKKLQVKGRREVHQYRRQPTP